MPEQPHPVRRHQLSGAHKSQRRLGIGQEIGGGGAGVGAARPAHAAVVEAQHGHAVPAQVVGNLPEHAVAVHVRVAALRARVGEQHHGRERAFAGRLGEGAGQPVPGDRVRERNLQFAVGRRGLELADGRPGRGGAPEHHRGRHAGLLPGAAQRGAAVQHLAREAAAGLFDAQREVGAFQPHLHRHPADALLRRIERRVVAAAGEGHDGDDDGDFATEQLQRALPLPIERGRRCGRASCC